MKLYTTWGAWGNLTIDSGHEMYIPSVLAEGKKLYRDVWHIYGPAAPYFTSYLYRLFGVKLSVLYWAGSLSALGSAIFLFLTGMRLSSWVAGWTAGAVLLIEAFEPSLFSFPLPYASGAVYACFVGCAFLWFAVTACFSEHWIWVFGAGTAAALALLLKPEFGIACYGTLALLIAGRWYLRRIGRLIASDVAAILPGMALCGVVIRWMVSIAGAEFITQENIMSWPSSYFMKTYGKLWLAKNGFTVSESAFLNAAYRAIPVLGVVLACFLFLRWKQFDARSLIVRGSIVVALVYYFIEHNFFALSLKEDISMALGAIFFPRDMVLYIIVSAFAVWIYLCRKPSLGRNFAISLLFTFCGLLAFRVLMNLDAIGYSIFYNGPVVLSYVLLLSQIIPRSDRSRRFLIFSETVLVLACLTPVFIRAQAAEASARDFVPFSTDRGTIRVPRRMAEGYRPAIQFMKEKAALGQSVLSVPEDTSLYFLSETHCPIRVCIFIPGLIAPGKMTEETIAQIEKKPVDYLLWSHRDYGEYGVSDFGEGFNTEIGDYMKSHYHSVGPLVPNVLDSEAWQTVVWERNQ